MSESLLLKLLKADGGETLDEDNDHDVTRLIFEFGYLRWNDDEQTHEVTDKGKAAIVRALQAVTDQHD